MPRFDFQAIGTSWQIDLDETIPAGQAAGLMASIHERIARFDRAYSRFREDSWVGRISVQAGRHRFPEDAEPMFSLYHKLYGLTGGLFTPLIGQSLNQAGYDAECSFVPQELTAVPNWDEVLEYEWPYLTVKKPVSLDLGGIGKGYLIEIVSGLISAAGVPSYCVDAGGDIRNFDADGRVQRIGLENPNNVRQAIGAATIGNQAICGSSGNRRRWDRFHHIIDPHSLSSPRSVLAAWTVADDALIGDALATCLFLVPPERLTAAFDFQWLILKDDFSVAWSPGFPAELFVA